MRFARMIGSRLIFGSVLVITTLFSAVASKGATISYGNFGPVAPGITFVGVEESSSDPLPLFGAPSGVFATGLDFKPTNFEAKSENGGVKITDGQLNFTILGGGPIGVSSLNVLEAGDYTIGNVGGAATSAAAGLIIRATVTAINGVAISPISLTPQNASFLDSMPGPVIAAPWSIGATLNVASQLVALGRPATDVATRVDIAINNALLASSEQSSGAFIKKKEFLIKVTPTIPEPTTLLLLVMGLVGVAAKRSR